MDKKSTIEADAKTLCRYSTVNDHDVTLCMLNCSTKTDRERQRLAPVCDDPDHNHCPNFRPCGMKTCSVCGDSWPEFEHDANVCLNCWVSGIR